MKRHNEALAITYGACNPSAIAHSIIAACAEIRALPGHTGTAQITSDPAVRLMAYQLAYLCKASEFDTGLNDYRAACDACEAANA